MQLRLRRLRAVCLSAVCAAAVSAAPASAAVIEYDLEGTWGLGYRLAGGSGAQVFGVGYDVSTLTVTVDTLNEVVRVFGDAAGEATGADGAHFGTSTASFDLTYRNVYTGIDPETGTPVEAIARQGRAELDGTITALTPFAAGQPAVEHSFDVQQNFLLVNADRADWVQEFYSEFFESSGFSFLLGFLSAPGELRAEAWLRGQWGSYNIGGDLHARATRSDTEIPEPATAALLGLSLAGAALRRKRQEEQS